ncbi:hypothetical protein Tco_1234674 [Tanacetum coccineum]
MSPLGGGTGEGVVAVGKNPSIYSSKSRHAPLIVTDGQFCPLQKWPSLPCHRMDLSASGACDSKHPLRGLLDHGPPCSFGDKRIMPCHFSKSELYHRPPTWRNVTRMKDLSSKRVQLTHNLYGEAYRQGVAEQASQTEYVAVKVRLQAPGSGRSNLPEPLSCAASWGVIGIDKSANDIPQMMRSLRHLIYDQFNPSSPDLILTKSLSKIKINGGIQDSELEGWRGRRDAERTTKVEQGERGRGNQRWMIVVGRCSGGGARVVPETRQLRKEAWRIERAIATGVPCRGPNRAVSKKESGWDYYNAVKYIIRIIPC